MYVFMKLCYSLSFTSKLSTPMGLAVGINNNNYSSSEHDVHTLYLFINL